MVQNLPKALKSCMAQPAAAPQVGASQPPHFYLKNQSRSLSCVKNYLSKKTVLLTFSGCHGFWRLWYSLRS